jgi:fatty acid synthase
MKHDDIRMLKQTRYLLKSSVHYFQVLRDAILENQTEADFVTSAGPKAVATHHLDELSRHMCPHLHHFVVFSSVSCGRGVAGQTNYGMNNSIMERICEARVRDGLPGLAVQWGAVGDVGLVAEMREEHTDIVIGQLHFGNGFRQLEKIFCAEIKALSAA